MYFNIMMVNIISYFSWNHRVINRHIYNNYNNSHMFQLLYLMC